MRSAKVLEDALALIENPENWIKGFETDCEGRYCAVGAANAAAGHDYVASLDACIALLHALTPDQRATCMRHSGHVSVPVYNDLSATRHSSIVNLFKRAIKAEKQ